MTDNDNGYIVPFLSMKPALRRCEPKGLAAVGLENSLAEPVRDDLEISSSAPDMAHQRASEWLTGPRKSRPVGLYSTGEVTNLGSPQGRTKNGWSSITLFRADGLGFRGMRRRIVLAVIGAPLALIAIGAGAAVAVPRTRHLISGLLNMPDQMPALAANSLVHYQPGAEDFARDVAALLPDAIERVEDVHGRRFAHPVIVGVYATSEAYAAANGLGSTVPVGVTIFGRVNLSPKLFGPQHQRLRAILTHELSHAHIQGWIGEYAYLYLPNWFKEGLAVMLSGGGGAELVSEVEARIAIQRGERLVIDDAGSLTKLTDVRLKKRNLKIDRLGIRLCWPIGKLECL